MGEDEESQEILKEIDLEYQNLSKQDMQLEFEMMDDKEFSIEPTQEKILTDYPVEEQR